MSASAAKANTDTAAALVASTIADDSNAPANATTPESWIFMPPASAIAAQPAHTVAIVSATPIIAVAPVTLSTHHFHPDSQSGGSGNPKVTILMMRRIPLVNQDNRLRLRFPG